MDRNIKQVDFITPAKPDVTRVAAYARVSSGKDAMLHSLSAQVSYYSKLIQNHSGWLYCGVYADEAITGTKETRENFQTLLSECRAGNIDLIIGTEHKVTVILLRENIARLFLHLGIKLPCAVPDGAKFLIFKRRYAFIRFLHKAGKRFISIAVFLHHPPGKMGQRSIAAPFGNDRSAGFAEL